MEAHGGRIWATSEGIGRGARFTFTIPAEVAATTKGRTRTPEKRREPVRVLVVDDDPQMLRYIRSALSTAGYSLS